MTDNETPEEIRFVRDDNGDWCGCENESQLHRKGYSSIGPFYRQVGNHEQKELEPLPDIPSVLRPEEPEKPTLREWVFRETGEVRPPKEGELFLGKSIVEVYRARYQCDITTPATILTLTVREIKPGRGKKIERFDEYVFSNKVDQVLAKKINEIIDKVEGV